jgi:hypothetical protein
MNLLKTEKIELINVLKFINPKLNYEIFKEGILIYEKNKGTFKKLKDLSFLDYLDSKELFKEKLENLKI